MKPIIQVIIDYILRLILIVVFCFVFPAVLIFLKIFRKKLIEKSWAGSVISNHSVDSNLSTYWNQRNEIYSFKGLYSQNRLKGWNFRRLLFKIFPNMFKKKKEDQEKDIYPMW